MKIIGTDGDKKCIIECSEDEVANLIGYHSYWSDGFILKDLIGKEIQISKMYQKLYRLSADHRRIKETRTNLKEMLDILDDIEPVLTDLSDKE